MPLLVGQRDERQRAGQAERRRGADTGQKVCTKKWQKMLKNIVLSDGGKIEVKYERNYGRKGIVGGIRLKSLVFSNELNGRSDTISYGYPRVGVSVYTR